MSAQPKLMSDLEGLAHQVDPLSRRGFFLATSAATAAGYTLAAGPVRADAIKTDTNGLTAGDAKVKVADGEMPVYFARPANVQNPPVIMVAMEIFGLHEYIQDVTRRLGKLGAFAIAPDYYFRKGEDLTKITEMPKLMPIVNSKPDADFSPTSTPRWRGPSRRAAIPTGSASWASAAAGARFGNTPPHRTSRPASHSTARSSTRPQASIWPKSPTALAPQMQAPVLGLYGEADQGIPVTQVEAMKAALQPLARRSNSRSTRALRTASTPIIARATARKPPRMPGKRCWRGSRNTKC